MYNSDLQDWQKSLKCQKESHNNSKILELILDRGLDMKDRLLCKYCIQIHKGFNEKVGIAPVLETIQQKYVDFKDYQSEQIKLEKNYLIELKECCQDLRSNIYEVLTTIENLISELDKDLDCTRDIVAINLMDELTLYIEQQTNKHNQELFDNFTKAIQNIKNCYQAKIESKIQNLNELISSRLSKYYSQYMNQNYRNQEYENKLLQNNALRQSKIKIITKNEQENFIKLNYVSEIDCQECSALTFDNECTKLVVCGGQNKIQFLRIQDGILKEKITTLQHVDSIFSIVYSKNQNWLAIGANKGEVKTWKIQNLEWESSPPQCIHKKSVFCLILNKNEDLLFSCSEDQSIIIWSLIVAENKIQKKQQIVTDQGSLFSISLSESEKNLAACSRRGGIFIWEYQNNNQWILKQNIQLSENGFGFRLCFYGEDYLFFQPQNEGVCKVYQQKNNIFELRKELEIELNQKESKDGIGLSPMQYNNIQDVMTLKFDKCIYFIKKQLDQKFAIIGSSTMKQNCLHTYTVSQNGQYFAEWSQEKMKICIYRLDYQ